MRAEDYEQAAAHIHRYKSFDENLLEESSIQILQVHTRTHKHPHTHTRTPTHTDTPEYLSHLSSVANSWTNHYAAQDKLKSVVEARLQNFMEKDEKEEIFRFSLLYKP